MNVKKSPLLLLLLVLLFVVTGLGFTFLKIIKRPPLKQMSQKKTGWTILTYAGRIHI